MMKVIKDIGVIGIHKETLMNINRNGQKCLRQVKPTRVKTVVRKLSLKK